jgi:hypothetical protein
MMTRFLSIYLLLVVIGMALLELPMLDGFYLAFGAGLATFSGIIIHLFASTIMVAGTVLGQSNGGFAIQVTT